MGVETIAYLEAIVGADLTSFRRGMAEVRSELTETSGLGAGLQSLGTTLTLGLTVPLLAVGVASLKVFSDFDSAIRNINSIMQLPEAQLEKLSDDVLKFGENTRNGATAAATALYTIVSAGFGVNDTAEAMRLLAVASKTAEAGLADENVTAQTLAQSLLAYGAASDQAQHYADVLTQTVNLGVGSMDDVAHSMGQAINVAALTKVSFDDLNGSAAFLTQRGMSFANAYTSLNQTLTQLIKPTDGLKAAYEKLGVAGGTELIAKFGGLGGALQALGTVSGTSSDDLAKLFTNVRALRGVASILGNFGDYGELMKAFGENLSGATDRAQQQQLLSFASRLDYLKSAVTGFLTKIGQDLAPLVGKVTDFLQGLFDKFNALDPVVIQNAVQIGLLVAAIGPLVYLAGLLLSPLGLITAALVLLAKAWSDNFLGIRDLVTAAIPSLVKAFNDIKLFFNTLYVDISQALYNINDTFHTYFGDALSNFIHDIFIGNWEKAKTDLQVILTDLGYLFNDKLKIPIDNAINGVKEKVGEMLSSLSPDKFVAIAVGIGVFAGALAIAAIPTVIGAITTAVSALATAFLALNATALAPFIVLGVAIAALVVAWENNFLGLKDRTNELRDTLLRTVETLKQLLFLFDYFTQGEAKAKQDLAEMFGMNTGSNIRNVPGQEDNPYVFQGGSMSTKPQYQNQFTNAGMAAGDIVQSNLNAFKLQYQINQGRVPTPNYNSPDPYGSRIKGGTTVNNIQVTTNDPTSFLNELRRRNIDLGQLRRG